MLLPNRRSWLTSLKCKGAIITVTLRLSQFSYHSHYPLSTTKNRCTKESFAYRKLARRSPEARPGASSGRTAGKAPCRFRLKRRPAAQHTTTTQTPRRNKKKKNQRRTSKWQNQTNQSSDGFWSSLEQNLAFLCSSEFLHLPCIAYTRDSQLCWRGLRIPMGGWWSDEEWRGKGWLRSWFLCFNCNHIWLFFILVC